MAAATAVALSVVGLIIVVLSGPSCVVEGNLMDAIGQVATQLSVPMPTVPCLDEYRRVETSCPPDIQTPEQCPRQCRQELKKFDACANKVSTESGMVDATFTDHVREITSTCGADLAALASGPFPDALPSGVVAGANAILSNPSNAVAEASEMVAEASKVVADNSKAIADGAKTLASNPAKEALAKASQAATAVASTGPATQLRAEASKIISAAMPSNRNGSASAKPSAASRSTSAKKSSSPSAPKRPPSPPSHDDEAAMPSEGDAYDYDEAEPLWFRTFEDDGAMASIYASKAVRSLQRTTLWLGIFVAILVALLFRA